MLLMSRIPAIDMYNVRGSAWRERVKTSTAARSPLHVLLVPDTELLLLVDHNQSKVVECDIALYEPMGADDDVDPAA